MINAVVEQARPNRRYRTIIKNSSAETRPSKTRNHCESIIIVEGDAEYTEKILRVVLKAKPWTSSRPSDEDEITKVKVSGVATFLSKLYEIEITEGAHTASMLATRYLNRTINRGRLDICGAVLRAIDVKRISAATVISVLGITLPVKSAVPGRSDFIRKSESLLEQSGNRSRVETP